MFEILDRHFPVRMGYTTLKVYKEADAAAAVFYTYTKIGVTEATLYIVLNNTHKTLTDAKSFLEDFFAHTVGPALLEFPHGFMDKARLIEVKELEGIFVAEVKVTYKRELGFVPDLTGIVRSVVVSIRLEQRKPAS